MLLVDTNVFSELRRRTPNPHVLGWHAATRSDELFTSVLVIGELRRGVESRRRRDPVAGAALDAWLRLTEEDLGERVLPVTREVADRWGRLNVPDRLPAVDGLLAATALVHNMTIVTRNVADVRRTGAKTVNPFEASNRP